MLGWLVTIAILLCASCIGREDDDPAGPTGPPVMEQGGRGSPQDEPDDGPCWRACELAGMEGCVDVSAMCADGGWPLFAVVGGIGILCSRAMTAACGGSTGVATCQMACAR